MHIRELELYGFKSFGERVKIGFHPHLTAIVGPNGSGKSNIVDSIRWLLGDQSNKSLRVPSSEEVIFKGADNGSPYNFSHVGMVIDLDEEGECKFERRYHRSGENEYILNGKTVRLKDIRSLLSSKGFGLGSLSILSQGQIDTILSLVPTDRRVVLEEVAQITNFKDNKSRILKKLDNTRDNLTRLDDILREVDSRIKELGEQAEAARKHRELANKCDELEIKLSFKEVERLVKNIKRNIEELEEREQELFWLKKETENLETRKTTCEKDLDDLRNKLESELQKSHQRSLKVEKARSAMDIARTELDGARESRCALESSIQKVELEIEKCKTSLSTERDNLVKAGHEKKEASKNLNEILENHRSLRTQEDSLLAEMEKRSEETSRLKTEIDISAAKLLMLEERAMRSIQYLEEGEEAFKDRTLELDTMRNRLSELNRNIEELSGQIAKKDSEQESLGKLLSEVEDEIGHAEEELNSLKDNLIAITSELKILDELEKKLVGYQLGVRRILEAKSKGALTGIIGTIVDLIKVESGFEKAVEAALGSRGQYIVVEKFDDGFKSIEYLKTIGGRATFLPLEDFHPTHTHQADLKISKEDGFSGCALDRIRVDEEYKSILEDLLQGTLIFTDLKSAREARGKYNLKQDIVTLDGEIHRHGGIFTGGSIDTRGEGPLVRRSRMDELARHKSDGEINIASIREKLAQAKALKDEHNRSIKVLNDETIKLREERNLISNRNQYFSESITTLERELDELRGRRGKTEKELADLVSEIDAGKKTQADSESKLDAFSQLSASDETRKTEILQERSLREDEINRLRIHISSREQEEEHLRSKISDEDSRIQNLNEEQDLLKNKWLEKLATEEDAESRHIRLQYKSETEIERLKGEAGTEESLKNEIDGKRAELADARNLISETSVQIEQLNARRESQSLRVARMETELIPFLKKVATIENVKDEYPDLLNTESEDFNRFLNSAFINELPPRKQVMDELTDIKSKLAEIGEVNVLAERDYENYHRRKIFLTTEKNDLVKAADELMESLGEIEEESKKAFKEVFDKTKVNFEEIFQDLYPDGKAELLLANPDDLLESGLEIKVKFPGKKELDLLQFSGGERSIIAIAFLFAVLRTKPPSFVFLDEVEAALDDVNVDKYISLMKKFSDKFQFIIVTHNKLTMEYARELWGVTMKKGGMSQVVSISLDEWINEHPQDVRSSN